MYQLDSSHVWHVAKTGNNGNSGHAGQYPINLANDAKLTIGAAVSAAASGDTIVIWPGDYAEAVSVSGKALAFIGTNRNKSKIVPVSGDGLTLDNNCSVKNLAIEALATNAKALKFFMKENLTVEDCDIYGGYDGIYFSNSNHIFLKNCRIRGKYDGGNLGSAEGLVAENCIFQGLGTYSTTVDCRALYGIGKGAFLNCAFLAERNDTSSKKIYAIYLSSNARAVFSNCIFEVSSGADHTGNIGGVYVSGTNAAALLKNCSVRSVSSGNPSSGPYDLFQVNGKIIVSASNYETTSGTIIQGGYGWSEGIEKELTDINLDKAAKLLLNKAIQDKTAGKIDYYDDDGQTIILTHTPTDSKSTIERIPS